MVSFSDVDCGSVSESQGGLFAIVPVCWVVFENVLHHSHTERGDRFCGVANCYICRVVPPSVNDLQSPVEDSVIIAVLMLPLKES